MSIAAVLANEQPFHVEVGNVLDGLRNLPDGCLQSVVTSPPYWNLRSYLPNDHADKGKEIGSERTPREFVETMVGVFREVRRVLRDDGTIWVNLGDSYDSGTSAGRKSSDNVQHGYWQAGGSMGDRRVTSDVTKTGDLMNMPHLVAAALRDDGWYWRATIVWAKKSPMPESISGWRWSRCRVKVSGCGTNPGRKQGEQINRTAAGLARMTGGVDTAPAKWSPCPGCPKCLPNNGYVLRRGKWRPTTAHEYIFLFAKSETYFCDGDAVQEACSTGTHSRGDNRHDKQGIVGVEKANGSWHDATAGEVQTRNPRSVWSLSSEPEKAKHFATFPSAIPRKCLTAATSKAGCCPQCGACYAPVVESERVATRPGLDTKCDAKGWDATNLPVLPGRLDANVIGNRDPQRHVAVTKVNGYRQTCNCQAGEPVPCLVADIFSGSGTTGRVAYSMGLRYIGFELSEEYAAISREKIIRPFPSKAAKRQRMAVAPSQRRLFA